MFHSRRMEHRINNIGRVLQEPSYCPSDSKLTFKDLLDKKTVSIYQKNIQALATEILKQKLDISLEIFKKLFSFINGNCDLRSQSTLK